MTIEMAAVIMGLMTVALVGLLITIDIMRDRIKGLEARAKANQITIENYDEQLFTLRGIERDYHRLVSEIAGTLEWAYDDERHD